MRTHATSGQKARLVPQEQVPAVAARGHAGLIHDKGDLLEERALVLAALVDRCNLIVMVVVVVWVVVVVVAMVVVAVVIVVVIVVAAVVVVVVDVVAVWLRLWLWWC